MARAAEARFGRRSWVVRTASSLPILQKRPVVFAESRAEREIRQVDISVSFWWKIEGIGGGVKGFFFRHDRDTDA